MKVQKHNATNASEKHKNLLIIVIGFIILYLIFKKPVLVYLSAIIGVISLISEKVLDWILWLWGKIGLILGWINTRIILAIVFFLFLLPIGLLFRMVTKNALQLKDSSNTVFGNRNHTYQKRDLENIW